VAGVVNAVLSGAARLYGAAWELRRRAYAAGWLAPRTVPARVVSVGNLTVGGTGKTTLTLHLARAAFRAGRNVAVVCRRYRPGPGGLSDEELLLMAAFPDRVFAGRSKVDLAAAAAAAGHDLVLVDDGFSHWPLARDLDLVLLDGLDPWGGGALLPAGRLREPRRALQRADWLILTRLPPGPPDLALADEMKRHAPGARLAAGRHRVTGLTRRGGGAVAPGGRVRVVTATGNPEAIAESAREIGCDVVGLSAYRDHHWFSVDEARREHETAERTDAVVLLTLKDAVRWPGPDSERVRVLHVEWEWVLGGEQVLDDLLGSARMTGGKEGSA